MANEKIPVIAATERVCIYPLAGGFLVVREISSNHGNVVKVACEKLEKALGVAQAMLEEAPRFFSDNTEAAKNTQALPGFKTFKDYSEVK